MKFLGQDFILGIHTKFQCDMMKQFGSCLICVCRLKFLKPFWLKKGIPRKEAAERVFPREGEFKGGIRSNVVIGCLQ